MSETDAPTALETVNLQLGPVATIELNRPQALNAWNKQLGLDLLAAVRGCRRGGHRARRRVISGSRAGVLPRAPTWKDFAAWI